MLSCLEVSPVSTANLETDTHRAKAPDVRIRIGGSNGPNVEEVQRVTLPFVTLGVEAVLLQGQLGLLLTCKTSPQLSDRNHNRHTGSRSAEAVRHRPSSSVYVVYETHSQGP